jgi:hypothetical protein
VEAEKQQKTDQDTPLVEPRLEGEDLSQLTCEQAAEELKQRWLQALPLDDKEEQLRIINGFFQKISSSARGWLDEPVRELDYRVRALEIKYKAMDELGMPRPRSRFKKGQKRRGYG